MISKPSSPHLEGFDFLGAPGRNRTRVRRLQGASSTIELRRRLEPVRGFEPPTSWLRIRCSAN